MGPKMHLKSPMKTARIAYENAHGYVEKKMPDCKQTGIFSFHTAIFIAAGRKLR